MKGQSLMPTMTENQVKFFLYDSIFTIAQKLGLQTDDLQCTDASLKLFVQKISEKNISVGCALENFIEKYLEWFKLLEKEPTYPITQTDLDIIFARDTAQQALHSAYQKL